MIYDTWDKQYQAGRRARIVTKNGNRELGYKIELKALIDRSNVGQGFINSDLYKAYYKGIEDEIKSELKNKDTLK